MNDRHPNPLDSNSCEQHWQFNRRTRGLRKEFTSHRNHLMSMIEQACAALPSRPCKRAAVLGGGNSNDIDLGQLTEQFEEVHLVDIDQDAVDYAVNQLNVPSAEQIVRHAPVDVADPLLSVEYAGAGEANSAHWLELLRCACPMPVADCDLVVSAGLLSQLTLSVHQIHGDRLSSEGAVEIVQAVRAGHFERILAMLRPGGKAVLGLDFVSSDSAPVLQQASGESPELPMIARRLIEQQNFFTGMNPGVIAHELRRHPAVVDLQLGSPWLWRLPSRTYLVAGAMFSRR